MLIDLDTKPFSVTQAGRAGENEKICSRGFGYLASAIMISEKTKECSVCSTIGMSTNSWSHLRGYTWLPSSSTTDVTTIFGTRM